jgi:cytochrome P450
VSREELLGNVALLLFAGHESTVHLIANGILTLLRHPGVLKRVGSEPGFAVLAVEELLRYEPAVHFLPNRLALDAIEIAGVTIPAGAPIRVALAAGNRDPTMYATRTGSILTGTTPNVPMNAREKASTWPSAAASTIASARRLPG